MVVKIVIVMIVLTKPIRSRLSKSNNLSVFIKTSLFIH